MAVLAWWRGLADDAIALSSALHADEVTNLTAYEHPLAIASVMGANAVAIKPAGCGVGLT